MHADSIGCQVFGLRLTNSVIHRCRGFYLCTWQPVYRAACIQRSFQSYVNKKAEDCRAALAVTTVFNCVICLSVVYIRAKGLAVFSMIHDIYHRTVKTSSRATTAYEYQENR